MLRTTLLAATLCAAVLPAAGQSVRPRAQLDYFVTRFEASRPAPPADGLGARVMWTLPGAREAVRAGVYALHTPGEDEPRCWRIGAQVDRRLWTPAAPVETFLSLGAGVVAAATEARPGPLAPPSRPIVDDLIPVERRSPATERELGLSVGPGVGARVLVGAGAGLRADLRRVWDFRGRRESSTELSAGVTLPI